VGAPIFYRDVPLMPAKQEKGEIKPISPKLLPFISWRLRNVSEPSSRIVMTGLHTCANCHSFSNDGKTLGLDLDGPHNDKGLYAIVPIAERMSIRSENVVSWRSFRGEMAKDKRIGFMSQVSPDGRYVITATQVEYYVANFKNYRFLQVFYPTRGILAWYDRKDGRMHSLPGADDPNFVQANPVWSPDGKYLVFVKAAARDAYPQGRPVAEYPNDPNEVPIQYDLYRIPFNEGTGGPAEPIAGASRNAMSNSFPKISPDGKWIVFVRCRNGQLMRPDGQLYIVPAVGGEARRMNCNTRLMNSWHSFSPNGHWMVFSSKSRSPYTHMFLTHIDEDGNDTPAILIENATAANRAVNIPEFVNVPPGGIAHMDAPAADFYRLYDLAYEITEKGDVEAAIVAWRKALELDPEDANALSNYGTLLLLKGQLDQSKAYLAKALARKPDLVDARNSLGVLLMKQGKLDDAIAEWNKSLAFSPVSTEARVNLGGAFMMQARYKEALAHWRAALELEPKRLPVLTNVAWMLATCPDASIRNGAEAVRLAEQALALAGSRDAMLFDILGAAYAEAARFPEAVKAAAHAAALAELGSDRSLVQELRDRAALYRKNAAFHETR
jgi:tetratricopeptide (TPR) repeat protein